MHTQMVRGIPKSDVSSGLDMMTEGNEKQILLKLQELPTWAGRAEILQQQGTTWDMLLILPVNVQNRIITRLLGTARRRFYYTLNEQTLKAFDVLTQDHIRQKLRPRKPNQLQLASPVGPAAVPEKFKSKLTSVWERIEVTSAREKQLVEDNGCRAVLKNGDMVTPTAGVSIISSIRDMIRSGMSKTKIKQAIGRMLSSDRYTLSSTATRYMVAFFVLSFLTILAYVGSTHYGGIEGIVLRWKEERDGFKNMSLEDQLVYLEKFNYPTDSADEWIRRLIFKIFKLDTNALLPDIATLYEDVAAAHKDYIEKSTTWQRETASYEARTFKWSRPTTVGMDAAKIKLDAAFVALKAKEKASIFWRVGRDSTLNIGADPSSEIATTAEDTDVLRLLGDCLDDWLDEN